MRTIVAVDLETTGFSTKKDSILEIGVVVFKPYQNKLIEWSTLIGPPPVITQETTDLTGLTLKDFTNKNTISIKEALTHFRRVLVPLKNYVIVAHNAAFDLRFLNAYLPANGLREIRKEKTFCTFRTFQKKHPKQSATLSDACKKYRIKSTGIEHRALDDAKKCFNLYLKLNKVNLRIIK